MFYKILFMFLVFNCIDFWDVRYCEVDYFVVVFGYIVIIYLLVFIFNENCRKGLYELLLGCVFIDLMSIVMYIELNYIVSYELLVIC